MTSPDPNRDDPDKPVDGSQETGGKTAETAAGSGDDLDSIGEIVADEQQPPNTDDDRVFVSFVAKNTDAVARLLECSQGANADIRVLDALTPASGEGPVLDIDLSVLTDTQRRTLELAVSEGYYEDPRKITLEDLSEQLGVTKSAVSRRLKGAERRLVRGIFEGFSIDQTGENE